VRKSGERPHFRVSGIGFFLLAATLLISGCQKNVVVQASQEDIVRANSAAQEGDIAYAKKDFYAALVKYLESVRLNPNSAYVYNRLGIAYSQLKFYQQAGDAFQRSMKIDPKYSYSYNNVGTIFFAQKDFKKAEKYFKKAINMKNNEASFHMNLGSVYLEKKKPEKAIEEWRKGLALDSGILSKNSSVAMVGGPTSAMDRAFTMARIMASLGNVESTIENLKVAFANGFTDFETIRKLPDFDPIRNDKRFTDFVDETELLLRLRKVGLPEQSAK
jgi:tetratricopeptide (TPR) repeat protein